MARRIAISGKITSGKTAAASILRDRYGYQVRSIATPLKAIAEAMTKDVEDLSPLVRDICLQDEAKTAQCMDVLMNKLYPIYKGHDLTFKDNMTRTFLQDTGREFRLIDPDIWVKYIAGSVPPDCNIVVDDLRYANEMKHLKAAGFITVRIQITPEVQQQRVNQLYGYIDPVRLQNDSETELDNAQFDYVVDNNGSADDFVRQVENIVSWNWSSVF